MLAEAECKDEVQQKVMHNVAGRAAAGSTLHEVLAVNHHTLHSGSKTDSKHSSSYALLSSFQLQLACLAATACTAVVCVAGLPDNNMLVPLGTSTRVIAAQQGYGWTVLKASNMLSPVLRGHTLG